MHDIQLDWELPKMAQSINNNFTFAERCHHWHGEHVTAGHSADYPYSHTSYNDERSQPPLFDEHIYAH